MTRFLFLLSIIFLSVENVFSQIGKIQNSQPKVDLIGVNICYHSEANQFDMLLRSDNRFESKRIHIKLGSTPKETLESLLNLRDAIMIENTEFQADGKGFYVLSKGKAVANKGEYTAGHYYLTDATINENILSIVLKYGIEFGSVKTTLNRGPVGGSFAFINIDFPELSIKKQLTLMTKGSKEQMSDFVQGEQGTELSVDQIRMLLLKINDGTIRDNADAIFFRDIMSKLISD